MNIGINTRLLLPHGIKEGIARYIYEISKRLVRNHPEHQFYFFFDRPYNEEFIFDKNVVPVVINPPARHPILFYLWYDWFVPYYLKKYEIDVFFSPDNFLSLRTKVPQLLTVHDLAYYYLPETIPWAPRMYYQYFMPKYIQKATHIATVSQSVKDELIKVVPSISKDKITTIPNALPSSFDPITATEGTISEEYFIILGSINPRKNTERILLGFEAFAKNHPDVKIVVIGNFMWKKQFIEVWDRLNNEGKLIHIQGVSDEEVVGYVKHAIALIFASLYEGFGFPILEGFASGTPVITSNNSSMKEVGGEACLFVDPYQVEDISMQLNKIYEDPQLRASLVERGLLELKKYSWDDSAKAIGNLIVGMKL